MTATFIAAMQEWRRSVVKGQGAPSNPRGGLEQRIDRVMQITVAREMDRVERYMTVLASTGRRRRSSASSARYGAS